MDELLLQIFLIFLNFKILFINLAVLCIFNLIETFVRYDKNNFINHIIIHKIQRTKLSLIILYVKLEIGF